MNSKKIGLFAGPLIFFILLAIPHPSSMTPEAWKVIACAAFMLSWWVTEAVPLAVASLLPIVLLPVLGVMDIKTASAPYASPIVFLFMGGFMIALAMEKWNLHRRIALTIVNMTGTNANGIILGFMLATLALSMWISNTATTVMMLPIAVSVIQLLTQDKTPEQYPEKGIRNFALVMMLGIAYAANVGGTATIIGTPPNVVLTGILKETYDIELSFSRWLIIGIPFSLIMLFVTYFFLTRVLYPNRLGNFEGAAYLIKEELIKLGKLSTGEKRILTIFLLTACAWIFRRPINNFIPGFEISDTGIAMLATVALFVTPVNFKKEIFTLSWEDTSRLPWGILLLFGGGLSIAAALAQTGIIDLIGNQFASQESSILLFIILGLTAVSLFLTEIMSNVALVTIFLPVVGGIAVGLGIEPIHAMIPVTLAASCAFMLPMSTPPNAIVFASGHVKVSEMVRAGFILNIISILLISLLVSQVIKYIF